MGVESNQLPLSLIRPHYDALFFAYGASQDRQLGVPGEHLQGIHSARAFVGWYNGLPEYAHLQPGLDTIENVTIIGQGNVALDVARILLSPLDRLRHTDISESALHHLSQSRVRNVRIIGRRGPLQAPYTTKEVRELTQLPAASYDPVDTSDPFMSQSHNLPRVLKRLAEVLSKPSPIDRESASKHWQMQYLLNPTHFSPSSSDPHAVGSTTFETMTYSPNPASISTADASSIRNIRVHRAASPSEPTTIPTDAVFRSIGYKASAIPGLAAIGVPFDAATGIIPNDLHGRVMAADLGPGDLAAGHVPGMYCAGWVKRGPTGVIATTMADAFASADVLVRDWIQGVPFCGARDGDDKLGWEAVRELARARGIRSVSWADWEVIDAEERRRGAEVGRARVKCASVEEMLRILSG